MIRSAVLVSGKGTKLQSLLDSVFFGEIPELQLVAVISSDAGAYALKRARNAGIEPVVSEITYKALNEVKLTGEDAEKMQKLIDALEDLDDVQQVYTSADFDDEE